MAKGILVISMDIELGWGFRDRNNIHNFLSPDGKFERTNLNEFLGLLKHYNIPVTFAIVGHLLLGQCFENSDGLDEWFANCPCRNNKYQPLWYAPDLIEKILSMPQRHEIASHSFSHIIFNDRKIEASIIRIDFMLWKALAKKKGIMLKSFVFPRNQIGYLKLLRKFGFRCFRGVIQERKWLGKLPGMAIVNEYLGPIPSRISYIKDELVVIPSTSSPNLTSSLLPNGMKLYSRYSRILPIPVAQAICFHGIKRAIVEAIKTKKALHLWTHESNLNKEQLCLIDRILRFASTMRDKGAIEIITMSEASQRFLV